MIVIINIKLKVTDSFSLVVKTYVHHKPVIVHQELFFNQLCERNLETLTVKPLSIWGEFHLLEGKFRTLPKKCMDKTLFWEMAHVCFAVFSSKCAESVKLTSARILHCTI